MVETAEQKEAKWKRSRVRRRWKRKKRRSRSRHDAATTVRHRKTPVRDRREPLRFLFGSVDSRTAVALRILSVSCLARVPSLIAQIAARDFEIATTIVPRTQSDCGGESGIPRRSNYARAIHSRVSFRVESAEPVIARVSNRGQLRTGCVQ